MGDKAEGEVDGDGGQVCFVFFLFFLLVCSVLFVSIATHFRITLAASADSMEGLIMAERFMCH